MVLALGRRRAREDTDEVGEYAVDDARDAEIKLLGDGCPTLD